MHCLRFRLLDSPHIASILVFDETLNPIKDKKKKEEKKRLIESDDGIFLLLLIIK